MQIDDDNNSNKVNAIYDVGKEQARGRTERWEKEGDDYRNEEEEAKGESVDLVRMICT